MGAAANYQRSWFIKGIRSASQQDAEWPRKTWEQLGNRTCQIPCKTVKHDAGKGLKNQQHKMGGGIARIHFIPGQYSFSPGSLSLPGGLPRLRRTSRHALWHSSLTDSSLSECVGRCFGSTVCCDESPYGEKAGPQLSENTALFFDSACGSILVCSSPF